MKIVKGKIVEITEDELLEYWLHQWEDLMSFSEYEERLIRVGVKIVDNKQCDD